MWKKLTVTLLWLGFSIQSLALKDSYNSPKFFLKSWIDPSGADYVPLKVSYQVDENSFNNAELNKTISTAAEISLKVLSNLVLSSPTKTGIMFGDNFKCNDFWIRNIIKIQEIDAHFGLYITFSNNLEDELIETDKCQNGNQLFVISAIINSKKFLALEKTSQVKMLSSTLASVIFENNLHSNQLMREVDDYLSSYPIEVFPEITDSYCDPPIENCEECWYFPAQCSECSWRYYPNKNYTQCCAEEHCAACDNGVNCDSCISDYFLRDGSCLMYPRGCKVRTPIGCAECYPGYILLNDGKDCEWCNTGCETCYWDGIDNNTICTHCFDPDNSILTDDKCLCKKANSHRSGDNKCKCNPGFYDDNNGVCQLCNLGCKVCDDQTHCYSCFDYWFMDNNHDGTCSCEYSWLTYNTTSNRCDCPTIGYFPTVYTGICEPCVEGCAYCTEYDSCLSCVSDELENHVDKCLCKDYDKLWDPVTQSCVHCPNGTYIVWTINYNRKCVPCEENCANCDSPYTCFSCTNDDLIPYNGGCRCKDYYKVWDNATESCVPCPAGTWAYHYDGKCNPCGSSCKDCISWYDDCTECYPGMHLHADYYDSNTCDCDDPAKVFDPDTKTCVDPEPSKYEKNCGEGCNICKSPDKCEVCYDSENMISRKGVCSCTSLNQKFSISEKKCVDLS